MERDHQQIWAGLGGAVLFFGAAGVITMAVVPAQTPTAHLWHHDWFIALFVVCVVAALAGLYVLIAALFVDWPLPHLRSADASEPSPRTFAAQPPESHGKEPATAISTPSTSQEVLFGGIQEAAAKIAMASSPAGRQLALAAAGSSADEQPEITREIATKSLSEIESLEPEGDQIIGEAWKRQLHAQESGLGFLALGKDFLDNAVAWNARLRALAKHTMSIKERAQISGFGVGVLSGFGIGAEKIEEVIRANLGTLRTIKKRCQHVAGGRE